jgi:hypothetical protein
VLYVEGGREYLGSKLQNFSGATTRILVCRPLRSENENPPVWPLDDTTKGKKVLPTLYGTNRLLVYIMMYAYIQLCF